MIALSDSIRHKHTNELHFPRSCIIYLRSTKNTLKKETLQITFSDGQKITYKVPVLKLKNYSINEIFEKNLLILLPYYIINYEKELSKIASDAERCTQLVAEYDHIIHKLSEITYDDDTGLFHDILQMMRRVMNYLLEVNLFCNYSVVLCIYCTERENMIQACKNPIAVGNYKWIFAL